MLFLLFQVDSPAQILDSTSEGTPSPFKTPLIRMDGKGRRDVIDKLGFGDQSLLLLEFSR